MNTPTPLPWSWKYLLWYPLTGFIALLALFALFNIDKGLQDWLYNPQAGFPFQHSEWYETWLHDRIKAASNSLLLLVLAAIVWPTRQRQWHKVRAAMLVALIAMIAATSAMRSLKDVTGIYCPAQLQVYGGSEILIPKLEIGKLMLINDGEGRCWPGGHATAGFAWLAMFFAFRQLGWRPAANVALITALAYGHFLGLVQVIRGQHFLSHQMYTMAVCWLINVLLFSLWYSLSKRLFAEPPVRDAADDGIKPA